MENLLHQNENLYENSEVKDDAKSKFCSKHFIHHSFYYHIIYNFSLILFLTNPNRL
jgi:hypothetical protein